MAGPEVPTPRIALMPSARFLRRLVALTVTALLVVAGLVLPTVAGAEDSIQVSIAPTSAIATSEPANFSVTVSVTNNSSKAISGAKAVLTARSQAMSTLASLESWLSGDDGETQPGWLLSTIDLPDLAAGATTRTNAEVNLALARFGSTWGPRGISADVIVSGNSTGHGRGVLLWSAGTAPAANTLQTSTIVPILVTPPTSGLLGSVELQALTAPEGVLSKQLDTISGKNLTLAVDPLIPTSIAALGAAAPETARNWLSRLVALPNESFELSYADADLAGQLQAGATAPVVAGMADLTAASGSTATPAPTGSPLPLVTGWTPTISRIGWPAANTLVAANVPALTSSGFSSLLVASSNVDSGTRRPALTTLSNTPAMLVNSSVTQAYKTALASQNSADWQSGASQSLAFIAAAATDASAGGRFISALPRIALTKESSANEGKLLELLTQPWTTGASLSSVLGITPATTRLLDTPESVDRVAGIRALQNRQQQLIQFATVTSKPTIVTQPASRAYSSALSVSWLEQGDWAAAFDKNMQSSAKTLGLVSVVTNSDINMVGTQANIPIAVRNGLSETATVTVRAKSNTSRLVVEGETTITIQPDAQGKALIPVVARVSTGSAVLEITLTSPSGVAIGDPVSIPINIRADWEIWGLIGFGVAFLGLVIAGIMRTLARRRSRVEE